MRVGLPSDSKVADGIGVGNWIGIVEGVEAKRVIGLIVEVIRLVGVEVEGNKIAGEGVAVSSSEGSGSGVVATEPPPHATNPTNATAHRIVLKRMPNITTVIFAFQPCPLD